MDDKEKKTEEINELDELSVCQQSLAEMQERYAHLLADFDNYKKRSLKDHELQKDRIYEKVFKELIIIVDDFDRALEQEGVEKNKQGLSMIHAALIKLLGQFDVQKMTEYNQFDPTYHEAIAHVETDEHESGAIVQVLQKGYMIGDRVLRPAKVSVEK